VAAFPALFDFGQGVELRLASSLTEAELMTRKGITRLFGIKHHRILRGHIAHLPEFSESCLRLSHLVGSKQLQEQLQLLLARVALVENQPDIATRQDFDERNLRASAAISMAAQELAAWLPKLAMQTHELRLRLEQAPKIWSEVTGSIRDQQSRLFGEDFLRVTPWEWLSEFPRYLAAAQQRLEKLKSGGVVKEARLSEPIEQADAQLRALEADAASSEPTQADRLRYLRWMLEELRVSVFAQQLGTKYSVSPKRMAEWIAALK
jgi:ATP-dependent helicase HrpA